MWSRVLLLALASCAFAIENLNLVYQWKLVDFAFPSPADRARALQSKEFIPENNLILGLEVHRDRLFVTVPRWRTGVPASLTYIDLKEGGESPVLRPYPNWEAHRLPKNEGEPAPEIVSPFRVRADRCGRLWVMDTGIADIFGKPHRYTPSRVLLYDLNTDQLIRKYDIPDSQVGENSFLANLAVEDDDCEDTYAYFGDLGDPAIVVYSYKKNSSWRLKHHYFNYNPLFAEYTVSGEKFIWLDGVFGMGLSARGADGYSTLYFHPMTGTHEFAVSTQYLHNDSLIDKNFHGFTILGNRGPKGQASVSFLDKKTGVLFYALPTHDAVACWRTSNPAYTAEYQGRIHENHETMIFPNDIKVDENDNIWVLSDRLPVFLYSSLNQSDVNFRIFRAPVSQAIRNTVCDATVPSISTSGGFSQPSSGGTGGSSSSPSSSSGSALPEYTIPNEIKGGVQGFAVGELPTSMNSYGQPAFISGDSDLAFMFQPQLQNNNAVAKPSVQILSDCIKEDEDGKPKRAFELLIKLPLSLHVAVESP